MEYRVTDMNDWSGLKSDLVITDPPFGIDYTGTASNYNRDSGRVVDGYVEWDKNDYGEKVTQLLDAIEENTHKDGQGLVFSGWNNSPVIHKSIEKHSELELEGKLYWSYNFAPYCKRRPAHNVYEIYWLRKGENWYYSNDCSFDHCQDGESNLSMIEVKRNYMKEMPKYPTRLPLKIVKILVEHFSEPGDLVFDPLAGSGSVGIAAHQLNREVVLGDINKEGEEVFNKTLNRMS